MPKSTSATTSKSIIRPMTYRRRSCASVASVGLNHDQGGIAICQAKPQKSARLHQARGGWFLRSVSIGIKKFKDSAKSNMHQFDRPSMHGRDEIWCW